MRTGISGFFFFLLVCFAASAHQDRIITLRHGELIGLPEKHRPAQLDLERGSLRIGGNRLDFPPCMARYFPKDRAYTVRVAASWTHDASLLPPYLSILVEPRGKHYAFQLLLNLNSLRPIRFEIQVRESQRATSTYEILIDAACREGIAASLMKVGK